MLQRNQIYNPTTATETGTESERHRKSCKRNEKLKTYKNLNWLFN